MQSACKLKRNATLQTLSFYNEQTYLQSDSPNLTTTTSNTYE